MENISVLSLSGGLDSTMLLMTLLKEGKTVKAYSFDYGQKHSIELKCVKKNIKFLQSKGFPVSHQIIDLKDCFKESASSLNDPNKDVPKEEYDLETQKSTVVENRNVIFSAILYGKALAISKKNDKDVEIALGIHSGDHSVYPDTTCESFEACKACFAISNWGSERIFYNAPFINMTKSELLKEGIDAMKSMLFSKAEIKKILRNTSSCYDPDGKGCSCGKCGTCRERLQAFKDLGLKDPIKYYNK